MKHFFAPWQHLPTIQVERAVCRRHFPYEIPVKKNFHLKFGTSSNGISFYPPVTVKLFVGNAFPRQAEKISLKHFFLQGPKTTIVRFERTTIDAENGAPTYSATVPPQNQFLMNSTWPLVRNTSTVTSIHKISCLQLSYKKSVMLA